MFNRDEYINNPIEIEKELLLLLDKEKVKTVFDIGACEGEDSIRYSKLFPQSKVFAFEPRLDNCAKAKELFEKYSADRVVLENIALSDENGFADFFLSEGSPEGADKYNEWDFGNKSSSLLPPSEEMAKHTNWLQFNKKVQVQTIKLSDYVKEKHITAIDFAHIDVQGAELMVLKGAADFIKNISVIWMEVENVELYKSQPLKKDVESFMQAHGFVNVIDTVNEVAGDQLYVNKLRITEERINRVRELKKNTSGFIHKLKSLFKS